MTFCTRQCQSIFFDKNIHPRIVEGISKSITVDLLNKEVKVLGDSLSSNLAGHVVALKASQAEYASVEEARDEYITWYKKLSEEEQEDNSIHAVFRSGPWHNTALSFLNNTFPRRSLSEEPKMKDSIDNFY